MTIIWIALWVALSVFVVGIFVWTTRALFDQKAAWKKFAAARGLAYTPGKFLQSASVRGTVSGYEFYLTSEERIAPDMRGRKFVTLVQFGLPHTMPGPGAVGSGDFRDFIRAVEAKDVLNLHYAGWEDGQVLAKTDAIDVVKPYFTPERLRVLDALIKQKGVSVLYAFDLNGCYLRLETVDPMLKPGQLDKLIDGVVPMLKGLAP